MGQSEFSPDFTQVAYLQHIEGSMPGDPKLLALVSLDEGGLGESVAYYSQASQIYGWSLDSSYFAFITNSPQPTAMIGGPGVDPFPALSPESAEGYTDGVVFQVEWVDETRYLFLANNPRGWDILLGEVFQPNVVLVGFAPGQPPDFDFAY